MITPPVDEQKSDRVQLKLEASLLQQVDDWSWNKRVRSRSEAIRSLLRIGLTADASRNEPKN